jgi:hypothetical protein
MITLIHTAKGEMKKVIGKYVIAREIGLELKRIFSAVVIIFLLMGSSSSTNPEMAVPVSQQLPLFFKIFPFDRNFKSKLKDELSICVVFQKNYRESVLAKNEFLELGTSSYSNYGAYKVRYKSVSIETIEELDNYLSKNTVNVLYVAPLRAINISRIGELTSERRILSITGIPSYVDAGVSVGIDIKGEKPHIRINISQAKSENVDFSSQLLKLATVIE